MPDKIDPDKMGKNGNRIEDFAINQTCWTPERKRTVSLIVAENVKRFNDERQMNWKVELMTLFQAMLALCLGMRVGQAKWNPFNWLFKRTVEAPGLWDTLGAFMNDIDQILEKWNTAINLQRNRGLEKTLNEGKNLPRDTVAILNQNGVVGDYRNLSDYHIALCLSKRQGFRGEGHLGGNPFYDLAFLVAAAARNQNVQGAFDVVYKASLKCAMKKWAFKTGIVDVLKTNDFDNWYVDLKNDVLWFGKANGYAGMSGLSSYLAKIYMKKGNATLKYWTSKEGNETLKYWSSKEDADIQTRARNALPQIQSINVEIKRRIDKAFCEMTPFERRVYALRIGPAQHEEVELIGANARQADITEAELKAVVTPTRMLKNEVAQSLSCKPERVKTTFDGVKKKVLTAFWDGLETVFDAGISAAWLKQGIMVCREKNECAFYAAMDNLARKVSDENSTNDDVNVVLEQSLAVVENIKTAAEQTKRQATNSRTTEEKRKERLNAIVRAFKVRVDRAGEQKKERAERTLQVAKEKLAMSRELFASYEREIEKQEALLLWAIPAVAELKKINADNSREAIKAALEKIWSVSCKKIRKELWQDFLSFFWRDNLRRLWRSGIEIEIAHIVSDSIAAWVECLSRIDPENGEYRSLFIDGEA